MLVSTHWNKENTKTSAYVSKKIDKTPEKNTYESKSQKIYASMARVSSNIEIPIINYGCR